MKWKLLNEWPRWMQTIVWLFVFTFVGWHYEDVLSALREANWYFSQILDRPKWDIYIWWIEHVGSPSRADTGGEGY